MVRERWVGGPISGTVGLAAYSGRLWVGEEGFEKERGGKGFLKSYGSENWDPEPKRNFGCPETRLGEVVGSGLVGEGGGGLGGKERLWEGEGRNGCLYRCGRVAWEPETRRGLRA